MKKFEDERHKRYMHIIYEWNRRHGLQHGVGLYDIRKEQYGPEDFYCFSIAKSNFAEPDNFDSKIAEDGLSEEAIKLIKFAACDERLDLDMLSELNDELKAAGAKRVYLHPDNYFIKKRNWTEERQFGVQLLLIQDEDISRENK